MSVGVTTDKRLPDGIFRFFTHISGASAADGDLKSMKVTGTDAIPGVFGFIATAKCKIVRLNIQVIDGGIDPSKFGGLNALTSGVEVAGLNIDGSTAIDYMNGLTWKKNSDLGYLGGPTDSIASGNPNGIAGVRWTMEKAYIKGPTLHSGESLVFVIRDPLGGLTEFRTMVQGHW